ncbi:hypothetical protein VMT65_25500 [Nocardia sp. CDC153]|uniref:hypothetical protein n=1 Tax=Nocardia sp. CDC153 TaxID=3112167 RepID=UPI002DB68011|nr:hypothetical protein [Nocardia sp. CDC153]MEC3956414.1 hypothetical protein [Nocardia sp. CDC153]
MPVLRVHNYRVDDADLDTLLTQRAALIAGIRKAVAGLTETRLARLEDGTYLDTWRWESAEQMLTALGASQGFPLVATTMSLTIAPTATNAEIIDEH